MIFLTNTHTGAIYLVDQLHSKVKLIPFRFYQTLFDLGYTHNLSLPNLEQVSFIHSYLLTNDFSRLTDSELHTLLTKTYPEYLI